MHSAIKKLFDKLELQLRDAQSEGHPLRRTARCIEICKKITEELKTFIRENPFKDTREEIHFFKEEFPKFYSQYIYYTKIFIIETNRPAGSDKAQIKYLRSFLNRIKYFFDTNLDFYQYYRTGATHFDEAYFVRGRIDMHLLPDDLALAIDTASCTIQSYKVAKLSANELLRIYINTSISDLERKDEAALNAPKVSLKWTGPKVALIELIYALQGSGVFNNSTADIKSITGCFENLFDIELGNVYNVFQEMRLRKKNRSSFLDLLRERLIQRMDEADEGY